MATAPRIAIRPYKTLSGLPFVMESIPEAASQTFKQGALVVISQAAGATQGYLVECGADPVLIMGVASRDGQNGTAGQYSQSVYLAHPDMLFVGNMDTSASEGTGVTAATDRGRQFGVIKSSATNTPWYVDKAELTTGARVLVWNFWDGAQDGVNMAIGDTLGWVIFGFGNAYFQGLKTS